MSDRPKVSHPNRVMPALLDALGIDWRTMRVSGFTIDADQPLQPVTLNVRYILTDAQVERFCAQLRRYELVERIEEFGAA